MLRRVAYVLVHRACIVWLVCLTIMISATAIQLSNGRFTFRSSYVYDLFVASDGVVTQQEAAYQTIYKPSYQIQQNSFSRGGYEVHYQPRSWVDAEAECTSTGMHLAWVTSEEEQRALSSFIQLSDVGMAVWLGGNDMSTEGVWTWVGDGGSFPPSPDPTHTYSAWKAGEPNDAGIGEHCLSASATSWNDAPCSRPRPFICMEPPESTSSPPTSIAPPSPPPPSHPPPSPPSAPMPPRSPPPAPPPPRSVRTPDVSEAMVVTYCWRADQTQIDSSGGGGGGGAVRDLLSNNTALQEVCEVENAIFNRSEYDEWCYEEPSPMCLLGSLCASAQKSTSSITNRSCSPPLISPLSYFYLGWHQLPNATALLRKLFPGSRPPSEWPLAVRDRINSSLHNANGGNGGYVDLQATLDGSGISGSDLALLAALVGTSTLTGSGGLSSADLTIDQLNALLSLMNSTLPERYRLNLPTDGSADVLTALSLTAPLAADVRGASNTLLAQWAAQLTDQLQPNATGVALRTNVSHVAALLSPLMSSNLSQRLGLEYGSGSATVHTNTAGAIDTIVTDVLTQPAAALILLSALGVSLSDLEALNPSHPASSALSTLRGYQTDGTTLVATGGGSASGTAQTVTSGARTAISYRDQQYAGLTAQQIVSRLVSSCDLTSQISEEAILDALPTSTIAAYATDVSNGILPTRESNALIAAVFGLAAEGARNCIFEMDGRRLLRILNLTDYVLQLPLAEGVGGVRPEDLAITLTDALDLLGISGASGPAPPKAPGWVLGIETPYTPFVSGSHTRRCELLPQEYVTARAAQLYSMAVCAWHDNPNPLPASVALSRCVRVCLLARRTAPPPCVACLGLSCHVNPSRDLPAAPPPHAHVRSSTTAYLSNGTSARLGRSTRGDTVRSHGCAHT